MGRPCPGCGAGPETFGPGAHYCRPCAAARRRTAKRGPRKTPYKRDHIGVVLNSAGRRAKAKGLAFTLTRADIPPLPELCPVLGIRLERGSGVGGKRRASPTLDRITACLGYVPGNVRWVSHRYNSLRTDMTLDEAERLLADLRSITLQADQPRMVA